MRIVPIEEKSEIALSASLAVPAVLLNRQFGSESLSRIKIKPLRQGRTALEAIGTIDPEMRVSTPEIDQILTTRETGQSLAQKDWDRPGEL